MKSVYILGVGHNTSVCMDLAISCGYEVAGLYHCDDSRTGEFVHGVEIIGSTEELINKSSLEGLPLMLSMGDNTIRGELFDSMLKRKAVFPNFIHPSAIVSRYAHIPRDKGICIGAISQIQANSSISPDTIILSGAIIAHDVKIGSHCLLADRCHVGAYATVEDYVLFGGGALSISSKVNRIGDHACIGAGAVLTSSVEDYAVMAGNPARKIK